MTGKITKKAKIINSLQTLTFQEKEYAINFFTKYPVYDKLIDWNNHKLNNNEFNIIYKKSQFSKSKMKTINKNNPETLFDNIKCEILIKTKDFLIIKPLSFESLVFFNSFRCGGEGARWCIGDKNDLGKTWKRYLKHGTRFYFIYFINKNMFLEKKIMIKYNVKEDFVITWSREDMSREDMEIDSGILAIYLNNYFTILEFENDKQLCLDFENILLKNKKNEYLIDLIQKLTEDNNKEEREWEEWEKY